MAVDIGQTLFVELLGMTQYPDLSTGSISLTTSATNTGAFRWVVTYIPLESGSTLVAA